jgi:hypothetical protein
MMKMRRIELAASALRNKSLKYHRDEDIKFGYALELERDDRVNTSLKIARP